MMMRALAALLALASLLLAPMAQAGGGTATLTPAAYGGGQSLTPAITGSLPTASTGDTTVFTPTIVGGVTPYTLTAPSGTLPAGRSISGLSVVGTYSLAGTYSYTLRVTDALGARADLALSTTVSDQALTYPVTMVSVSNSIFSQSVGSYSKSVQLRLVGLSGGRLIETQAGDKGIPGTQLTLQMANAGDDMTSRIPRVVEQLPQLILTEGGHNDNPSTQPSNVIAYHATFHTALRAAAPNAIIVHTTITPSSIEGSDSTKLANLATVNASIMARDGSDGGKTIAVDVSTGFNYLLDTDDGIHLNSTGARKVAAAIWARISSLFPSVAIDTIMAEGSGQYGHGPNLAASKFALPGTGGAKAGTTLPTGNVADTMLLTNNTSATVVASKDVQSGYERQVITISGTVSAENTVVFSDGTSTNRTSVNAVPGEWFEARWLYTLTAADGVSVPVGVKAYGGIVPGTVSGISLGNYITADAQNVIWNNGANSPIYMDEAVATPRLARSYPFAQQTAATVYQNAFGIRLATGTVDAVLTVWKPILWRIWLDPVFAPIYAGSDFIKPSAQMIGLSSGTVANGNTLTFRPGAVIGGGAPSFGGMRIYSGGTSGGGTVNGSTYGGSAGIGTGTLLATLSAGTYTWVAAGMTSGTPIYLEEDATTALGTITYRSLGITVP